MDLIVTHRNADFDALSSLIAASKLYPGSRLLLPGSQERAVRSFLALIKDKIRIENEKTCRYDDIDRLIIVDNRHRSRIGEAQALLDKKGIELHIYDHHPKTSSDIKADKDVSKEVGATVTVLLEILQKEGKLDFTPLEATLMLLGIYEETGSLSFLSTTKLDVDMVSLLLEKGANLNAVSSYLNRELSESELSILIELLESIEVVNINGVNVAFSESYANHFDGEMGAVVHKLQDVENYPVLFALFRSKDKTKILARSRIELVNVNKILKPLNGAGHSSAAGALTKGYSIDHIKSKILNSLKHMIHPEIYAKDIMNFPVETALEDEKVSNLFTKLQNLGYRGAPVLNNDKKIVGMITLGDLKKALNRGMGHSRIKGYMSTPLITAEPKTPLHVLQKILMEKGKGRIPIVENNKLVGIITRTDILKKVHSGLFPEREEEHLRSATIFAKMKEMFPTKLINLIRFIGAEGDKVGIGIFLVGGFVRDLILERKNYDLDIAVEGDAIWFGKILRDKLGGALVIHRKFGTCTIVKDWPKWLGKSLHPAGKFKIDIATARKEKYETPAALPTVEFSSLRDDLYRRDFTINAMAININKKRFGLFVDFFGGIQDSKKEIIRVLHDKSFIDDPTRIFRAVRFEQRFGFKIEKHTEYLIKHAISQDMFRRTENQRIRDELILILKEENPEKAVLRMKELHELRFIHPKLVLKPHIKNLFSSLRKCIKWHESTLSKAHRLDVWLMNLMLMLDNLTLSHLEEVIGKFVFTKSEGCRLLSYKQNADKTIKRLSSKKKMLPSSLYALLERLSHEVTLCIMAKSTSITTQERIKKFFMEYNGARLKIRGHDIEREGIKPGPRYAKLLQKVLYKKLNDGLNTKREELEYLRSLL